MLALSCLCSPSTNTGGGLSLLTLLTQSSSDPPRRITALRTLAGEFLDQPFVPRLDGGDPAAAAAPDGDAEEAGDEKADEPAAIAAFASAAATAASELPVGSAVVVHGLQGLESSAYNGVHAVVVSALLEGGRQSLRLQHPFSGA